MSDDLKGEAKDRWTALINRLNDSVPDAPVFIWLIAKLVIVERELYAKRVLEGHHPAKDAE